MARIETDPNYTSPTFSRATAATDLFKKEDVQNLAAAFSTHTHDGAGKGLALTTLPAAAIGTGLITSAMIADATITGTDIAPSTITSFNVVDGSLGPQDLAGNAITEFATAGQGLQTGNGAYTGSGASTTSGTLVDIAGTSATFVVAESPTLVLIFYTFAAGLSNAGSYDIQLTLSTGGVSLFRGSVTAAGQAFPMFIFSPWQLAAGTYTVKLQWRTNSGGTVQADFVTPWVGSILQVKR